MLLRISLKRPQFPWSVVRPKFTPRLNPPAATPLQVRRLCTRLLWEEGRARSARVPRKITERRRGEQWEGIFASVLFSFSVPVRLQCLSRLGPGRYRRSRPRSRRRRGWRGGRRITTWNAHRPLIVLIERALKTGRFQGSIADRRNHQRSDRCICLCQGLRNACAVGAVGDVKLRCDFLVG